MTIQPFPIVEKAIKELLIAKVPALDGKVGGDLNYKRGDDLWVWINLVRGRTNEIDGEWIVDLDVFAPKYADAMEIALSLEAYLLPGRHRTTVMLLDSVYQNETPTERPWDDDSVFRVGATYVFTARRTG